MKISAGLFALLALASAPVAAQTPEEVAEAALEAAPIWDGHNDVAEQVRDRYKDVLAEFDFTDTTNARPNRFGPGGMQTDIPRLRQGHVGIQWWSAYVTSTMPEPEAVRASLEQIDTIKRLVARYPDDLRMAYSADDVEAALREGRIASLIGLEGGHSIGSSLGVLRQMYALGVRYMTLVHFTNNPWGDSADDDPEHGGLTEFGMDVVREMNRLGMVVDLSHVSEDTMNDALDAARAPLIFSHSGARAVNTDSRNVPDAVLLRLRDNGGIVMVAAYPSFVSQELNVWTSEREAEQARLKWLWQGQPDIVKAKLAEWVAAHPEPKATVSQLADQVDHIRDLIGIDHIGVGADYDGMASGPAGMEDVSGYPALFVELARRGYSQEDLEKIASRNMMRVLRAVEAYAAAHRDDPPIEYPVVD